MTYQNFLYYPYWHFGMQTHLQIYLGGYARVPTEVDFSSEFRYRQMLSE